MRSLRKDLITATIAIVFLTVVLGIVYPLVVTGCLPGVVLERRQWQQDRSGRQGRRLEVDRPGLPRPARATSRAVRRRPNTAPTSPTSTTSGPNNKELSEFFEEELDAYLKRERPLRPGPDRRRRSRRRGHDLGLGRRPAHLRGQRPHPGPPHRRGPRPAAAPGARPDRRPHRRSLPRRLRRAGRERAAAQPRSRQGSSPMTDETLRNRPRSLVRPRDHAAGDSRLADQARSTPPGPQPGHVRGRGRRRHHHRRLADPGLRRPAARRRQRAGLVRLLDQRLALADRRLRQPRRGAGRGSGQGAGRRVALDADRDRRPPRRRRREARLGVAPRRRGRGRRRARRSPATAP